MYVYPDLVQKQGVGSKLLELAKENDNEELALRIFFIITRKNGWQACNIMIDGREDVRIWHILNTKIFRFLQEYGQGKPVIFLPDIRFFKTS